MNCIGCINGGFLSPIYAMITYLIPQISNIKGKINMSYTFDPTGKALQNKVIGETKLIGLLPGRTHLYAIPLNGPFFSEGFIVKYTPAVGAERILIESIDYKFGFLYLDATRKINKPVYAAISLTDLTLNGTLTYSYQTLGSTYSTDSDTISSIENISENDPLFSIWENEVTMPEVPLITHPWSVVNVDDVSRTVEELAKIGLVAHLRPSFLPEPGEEVFIPTAQEVGLGNVPNYPKATLQQALAGVDDQSLMTPAMTAPAIRAEVINQLSSVGYLVPIPYQGGIEINVNKFTVSYLDEVYIIKKESVPFVTTGIWNDDRVNFNLFDYAQNEIWARTYITVTGDEPVAKELGVVFDVDIEHDSRLVPQLVLNDFVFLVHSADYKLSGDKLYVHHPISEGDKLVLFTKRSMLSLNRERHVDKVFIINGSTNIFDISDIDSSINIDNLRVTLNDYIILNSQENDYAIIDGLLIINYRLGTGDVLEIENIDSAPILGKAALRSLLAIS